MMRARWLHFVALVWLVGVVAAKHGEHAREVAEWARSQHHDQGIPQQGVPTTTTTTSRTALLERARAALAELIAYYEGDEAMLRDALRGSTAKVEELGARLVRKAIRGETIVIACLGSSVTAGHDGYGSTAWPAVLERRLRKVVEVEVLNQAVGGQQPYPASFCLESICGSGDVDAVFREWEYWSLDDGMEPYRRDVGRLGPAAAAEHVVKRVAGLAADGFATTGFVQLDVSGRREHKTKFLVDQLHTFGEFPVAVFSAFGVAFDHLRAKTQVAVAGGAQRLDRQGRKGCSGLNVGECPLTPYPDGYHSRAEFEGDDFNTPSKLFINWHPGSLGHEVVGNQLAYFLLTRLLEALVTERASVTTSAATATAPTIYPLVSSKVRCAVSTLPARKGPSVGDLVTNATAVTKWRDAPTPSAQRWHDTCSRPCGNKPVCRRDKKCSYRDQKRGFTGAASDGPLTLRIPFLKTDRCVVYLAEPGHEWNKPVIMANWNLELDVSVDGAPCGGACTVVQGKGDYIQALRVDIAQKRLGGSGCGPALLEVRVKPLPGLIAWEQNTTQRICAVARNGRCEPHGIWRRYDLKCRHDAPSACAVASPATRPPNSVRTYVDSVIFF